MPSYQYKVVPAPQKGLKAKGVRSTEARFSNALETLMNAMGEEGWEYQRAETLPSIERSGLASTTTEWRNVLVFRRLRETATEAFAPELLPPPETTSPEIPTVHDDAAPEGDVNTQDLAPETAPEPAEVTPEISPVAIENDAPDTSATDVTAAQTSDPATPAKSDT
jgi:hypothetical protein